MARVLRYPPVTIFLLVAIGAGFVLETLAGGSTDQRVLVGLGANYGPLVWGEGQWWRLLTSVFLHIGFAHLLVNGWALFQLGTLFENWLGSLQMLLVFLVSGVAGSLGSMLWHQDAATVSAGASGAIFGLIGALITFLLRRHDLLSPAGRSVLGQLVLWAGINVVFGLSVPGIDNAAHFGGAAAGLLCGLVVREWV